MKKIYPDMTPTDYVYKEEKEYTTQQSKQQSKQKSGNKAYCNKKNNKNLKQPTKDKKPCQTNQQLPPLIYTQTQIFKSWTPPRGIRIYHVRMFKEQYIPHTAKNNSLQDKVNILFSPNQQEQFRYADFKTLWKSEKGEIIQNKGGSHKGIIAPKGEKLCGIFAHNKNQTYGRKYIGYLQYYIWYIGLRPI